MGFKLTPRWCKAARALAGLSQEELARAANVAKQTIADFERGARTPFPNNLRAIQSALESADVVFLEGADGSALRYRGPERTAPGKRPVGSERVAPARKAPPLPASAKALGNRRASKLGQLRRVFDQYKIAPPARKELIAVIAPDLAFEEPRPAGKGTDAPGH